MAKYSVDLHEEWIQTVVVEAKDAEEALKLVQNGNGEYTDFNYSQTLSTDAPVPTI